MATVPQIDFSPIGSLADVYRSAQQNERKRAALQQFAQTQDPNVLAASGDPTLANMAMQYMQRKAQAERQAQQDARQLERDKITDARADRQFGATQAYQNRSLAIQEAAARRAGLPANFERTPEGGLRPIPGGPADPNYLGQKAATAQTAKDQATTAGLSVGGKHVLSMVDQLENKVFIDDKSGKKVANPLFKEASGPLAADLHERSVLNPARMGYELYQSRQAKNFLDQIKQDAQAINSTMQRELLKGGGAITEAERAQINQILGSIAASRSPEDAQALLNNFRGIVRSMFQMGDGTAAPSAGAAPPAARRTKTGISYEIE